MADSSSSLGHPSLIILNQTVVYTSLVACPNFPSSAPSYCRLLQVALGKLPANYNTCNPKKFLVQITAVI